MLSSTHESDTDSDDQIDPFTALLSLQHNDTNLVNSTGDPHFRRHHVVSLNADILIRQLPSEGLSFQLWPAATTLFSLLDNPNHHALFSLSSTTRRRIRILELGSGTGLVGIAASAILGADVTVTDLAHVIPNLEYNAKANSDVIVSAGGSVHVAELSWGDVDQMEAIGRDYDVILGSDVVYHDHLYEPLMETLRFFLLGGERDKEMVFVMAHLKRWKKEAAFFKRARKLFGVEVVFRDCPLDGKRVGVIVYRFVPKHRPSSSSSSYSSSSSSGSGLGLGLGLGMPKALSIPNLDNGVYL